MVKARELHPIQLDSDLSPEDWAERFASQAHLVSAENLDKAIGLIYRLDYPKVVCLIFGSGKMVITGARHKDEILEAVEIIKDELADLL